MSICRTLAAAQLDPQTQAFVDALAAQGGPPIYKLPVAEARAVLDTLQAGKAPSIPARVEDHVLPVGPGGSVPIRIVRPPCGSERLPVIMYFHGGGWILGNERTHDRLIREISNGAGAAVVFVKYTPSPEAQFPVPVEEVLCRHEAHRGARRGVRAGSVADGDRGRQRGRQHDGGGGAAREGAGWPGDPVPGAVLSGDRRALRHGLLPAVRGGAVAHAAGDEVVLRCVRAETRGSAEAGGVALAGLAGPAPRPAARARYHRRERRPS